MTCYLRDQIASLASSLRVQGQVNISAVSRSMVAMDSNKDEAERCIKIARNAVSNNQPDKARKFLEKAQRLFPTDQAKSTSNKRVFTLWFYVKCWAIAVRSNQLTLA